MHIALESKAIVFRVDNNSTNLAPLMHFVKNSFSNVKYLPNVTVISETKDQLIRKRYLLKWAYKIFYKNKDYNETLSFKQLNNHLALPIHIVNISNKFVEKVFHISIDHINTNNELRIRCNEYNPLIISFFERLFKNSIIFGIERRIFKVKIITKYDLVILKSLLSRKNISGLSVVFQTNGLNFSKINFQDIACEEKAYERKLQKSYIVLGITQDSTEKEVKNNYRQMLRKYHPDKVSTQGIETINLYTKRFQVIQEAYGLVKEHFKI